MKNKLLTMMLIVLVAVLVLAIIVFVLAWKMDSSKEEVSTRPAETIDDILEATVEIPEITTNLAENQFIKLALKIQADSSVAAEELAKREFQVRHLVIQELSEMTEEELSGKEGKKAFESTIRASVNALMQEGKVEQVYIVSYIIQ